MGLVIHDEGFAWYGPCPSTEPARNAPTFEQASREAGIENGAELGELLAVLAEAISWRKLDPDNDGHWPIIRQAHLAGMISDDEMHDLADCDGVQTCRCDGDDSRCLSCGGISQPCGCRVHDYLRTDDFDGDAL